MFSLSKVNKIAQTMYEIIHCALQAVVSRNDPAPTVCARLACSHVAPTDSNRFDGRWAWEAIRGDQRSRQ